MWAWTFVQAQTHFCAKTNGDIGHAEMAGGPLAKRRMAEVKKADGLLGIESEVLDIHDGELMPTLENRKQFVRLIRQWKADIVIGPRTNDYHPDHRYTGVLMQDAAFMVTVTHYGPDVPQLARNPVFLYVSDGFQRPNPFEPDIVVPLDTVFEKKAEVIRALESQIESLWATGDFEKVVPIPTDPQGRELRRQSQRDRLAQRDGDTAQKYRQKLMELCGRDAGEKVAYAEAFELCEYGRRPSLDELKKLFPMPGN